METKNRFSKLFKNRNKDESGYALVVVLGIIILTIGILSSMTIMTLGDVNNSNKNRAVLEARIAGESAIDTFYASINASGQNTINAALPAFKAGIGGSAVSILSATPATSNLGQIDADGTRTDTYYWPMTTTYYSVDPTTGAIGPCTSVETPCFKIGLTSVSTTPNYNSGTYTGVSREEYIADIIVRTKCQGTPAAPTGCTFARIQQTISKRKYVEYASISQSEKLSRSAETASGLVGPVLSPAFSFVNSYSSQDSFANGKIHTNDSSVRVCNGFFAPWVTVSNANPAAPELSTFGASITGCSTPQSSISKAQRNIVSLPTRVGDDSAVALKERAQNDTFGTRSYIFPNAVRIRFNGSTMNVYSPPSAPSPYIVNQVLPANGVIYLNAGGEVEGTLDGQVTVASAPSTSITISDDLRYAFRVANPSSVNGDDMLGIYSGKDIIVRCNVAAGGACRTLRVDGFLKANTLDAADPRDGGTIYNDKWATAPASGTSGLSDFILYGAMESYTRGTFGTIQSNSNGSVVTGFRKTVDFDTRLINDQPPLMLRDGSVPFIRSAVKDVPCAGLCS